MGHIITFRPVRGNVNGVQEYDCTRFHRMLSEYEESNSFISQMDVYRESITYLEELEALLDSLAIDKVTPRPTAEVIITPLFCPRSRPCPPLHS